MKLWIVFKTWLSRLSLKGWAVVVIGLLLTFGLVRSVYGYAHSDVCLSSLVAAKAGPATHQTEIFDIAYTQGWYEFGCGYYGVADTDSSGIGGKERRYTIINEPVPFLNSLDRLWGTMYGSYGPTTQPQASMWIKIEDNTQHLTYDQLKQQFDHPPVPPINASSTFNQRKVMDEEALVVTTKSYATDSSVHTQTVYFLHDHRLVTFCFFVMVQDPNNPHTGVTRDQYVTEHHAAFDAFVDSFHLK